MSNEQKIADVLSRMQCLRDDLIEANTREQAVGWMADASIAMDKAFELINEQLVEMHRIKSENEQWRRYSDGLLADKKALTETHVLYTWLRKKCDQPSNDVVAVNMNIGHDWVRVQDLDRDLRSMIEREEP